MNRRGENSLCAPLSELFSTTAFKPPVFEPVFTLSPSSLPVLRVGLDDTTLQAKQTIPRNVVRGAVDRYIQKKVK